MLWGVCGDPAMARIARQAGYDYFEWSVGGLLHPREEESVFQAALAQVKEVNLPCPALNVFVPGDLKITGPEANLEALERYVSTALYRAEIAGVETIVFGSGGARRIPDGCDRAVAHRQLVNFCQMLGPIACQHGVTIVIEPLNVGETNVLNTVGEGGDLAREVNHPNIRLLVDGYHWGKDHDTAEGILKNAPLLRHAHIATAEGRRPPHVGDECGDFLQVLKSAGYQGRVSIEGNIEHPAEELPAAFEILQKWG
jgi:sugar phosphate isomerase/epimerase